MRVVLLQMLTLSDKKFFCATRQIDLPMAPFVGMVILNPYLSCADAFEEPITEICYDLETGNLLCVLKSRACSEYYSDDEVREMYKDWSLEAEHIT